MKISRLVSKIPGSATLALTAKVNELKAQGRDVIGFTAGEPDFDTPDAIKQAAVDALWRGDTKYTPVGGTPRLKEAVCAAFEKDYGYRITPENVIVSCGAKHSLFNLFYTIFERGDEVICPAPYWVSYLPMIEMTGARVVTVDTRGTGMRLHADMVAEAITDKTRGIVINSPSNPTGMVFERKELEKIADLCVRHDITIVSDDIYRKIVFDGMEFFSVAGISPEVARRTFIIDGSSKTYAMTGWRIGFCIGDPVVIKAMERLQSQSTSNPVSFAQEGAAASLADPGTSLLVEERRKIFQHRRDLIVNKIREIPGMEIMEPSGSFYAFPSIGGLLDRFKDADDFARYMIEHALVAMVPGGEFGAPDHVRLSFATSEENIVRGLGRMKEAISSL
jgi:aspartate aminotransferase